MLNEIDLSKLDIDNKIKIQIKTLNKNLSDLSLENKDINIKNIKILKDLNVLSDDLQYYKTQCKSSEDK